MKFSKLFGVVCASLFAATAFADDAGDQVMVSINSTGPDCYADGSLVLNGEYYALVWVKTGADFAGFTADAKVTDPTNSALICAIAAAKDGRCDDQNFEFPYDLAYQYLSTGTLRLILLDTRTADKKSVGGTASGISGYGEIQPKVSGSALSTGSIINIASSTNTAATIASAIPAGAPQPMIKSIEVRDGRVYITVAQTVPVLKYNLTAGADVAANANGKAAEAKAGNATSTIVLEAPVSGGQQFFKVVRDPIK